MQISCNADPLVAEISCVTAGPPAPQDLLDPTLDVVFKLLMIREPRLLQHMLEGVLRRSLGPPRIIDADLPGEDPHDKGVIYDVRCVLDDGARVVLEMQRHWTVALRSRLLFYWARDFSGQLSRGDGYHRLMPTVVIAWLGEPVFPALAQLHLAFEVHERYSRTSFGEELSIHLLQLGSPERPALLMGQRSGYDAMVERWARFFTHFDDDAELELLAAEDPTMALAKRTLEELSQDPETRRRAREREDEIRLNELDRAAGLEDARTRGWSEGRTKGKAELLLKQLTKRFGPLPSSTRTRVETATSEQLDVWAERVLTEPTPNDVLALPPEASE